MEEIYHNFDAKPKNNFSGFDNSNSYQSKTAPNDEMVSQDVTVPPMCKMIFIHKMHVAKLDSWEYSCIEEYFIKCYKGKFLKHSL